MGLELPSGELGQVSQGFLRDSLAHHPQVVPLVDHPPHLPPRLRAVVVVAVHYYQHNRLPRPGLELPFLMDSGLDHMYLLSRETVGALPRRSHQVDLVDRRLLQQPWLLGPVAS
jgi:hypothetical protein